MAQMTAARTTSVSLERLLDEEVRDAEGHDIGKVEDLILDTDSGSIDFAIVEFGGFLGINSRYHLIPWPALKVDAERHNFVMDVTKARVDQAPWFDRRHVPATDDSDYLDSVFQYWGFDRNEQHQRAARVQYGEEQAMIGGAASRSYGEEQDYAQQQAYGSQEELPGYGREDVGREIAGQPSQRQVSYGNGTYGPERRMGGSGRGTWSGAERRAGW